MKWRSRKLKQRGLESGPKSWSKEGDRHAHSLAIHIGIVPIGKTISKRLS